MNKFKALMIKVWEYIKYLIKHPKTTLPAFLIAETIFWIPVWLPAVLYFITGEAWLWTIVGSVVLFWAGPITPAILLQVSFISLVERLITKTKLIKEMNKNGRN